jgi:hypothetical protein
MKELAEIGLTEEAVRPFARMTAQLITQDELQKVGLEVTDASRSSVITWWINNHLL